VYETKDLDRERELRNGINDQRMLIVQEIESDIGNAERGMFSVGAHPTRL